MNLTRKEIFSLLDLLVVVVAVISIIYITQCGKINNNTEKNSKQISSMQNRVEHIENIIKDCGMWPAEEK